VQRTPSNLTPTLWTTGLEECLLRHSARMPPELVARASAQCGVLTTSQLYAAGVTQRELLRLVRAGILRSVRRGVFVDASLWSAWSADDRYRALVVGTLLCSDRDVVASHESAAVLLGLAHLGPWPDLVHVTVPPASGSRHSGKVRRHAAVLHGGSVTTRCGFRVTTPARTAVDLARGRGFRVAVVTLDRALRFGDASKDELIGVLSGCAGWPGASAAKRAVAFADARSESVGESVSRVVLAEQGLAPDDLQHQLFSARGFVGRSDFWWEAARTVGEFDGKVKYGAFDPAKDPREVLWEEKKREDRIRDLNVQVVRWTWWDLEHPDGWLRRLRSALARGRRFAA
jgi:hypothetical protein